MTGHPLPIDISIPLDPTHPSLDHHRPGGDPLYGTAMSIDTLAATAATYLGRPADNPDIVEVEVLHPWILKAGVEPIIHAQLAAQTTDDGDDVYPGSLFSRLPTGGEDTHLRLKLDFEPRSPAIDLSAAFETCWGGAEVSATQIYSVFFHGPAFQLVAGVQASGDRVRSRMASTADTERLPERARLIEFALQTAGLWELCSSRRMMIPHGIRRIVTLQPVAKTAGQRVFAIARPSPSAARQAEIDIDVFDTKSGHILSVEGYQTVPLPFASDIQAASTLGEALAHTAVDAELAC